MRRGVEVRRDDGSLQTALGRRVILTAGALQTPAMLLRAGIGPERQLRDLGIPIVLALNGVGTQSARSPFGGVRAVFAAGIAHAAATSAGRTRWRCAIPRGSRAAFRPTCTWRRPAAPAGTRWDAGWPCMCCGATNRTRSVRCIWRARIRTPIRSSTSTWCPTRATCGVWLRACGCWRAWWCATRSIRTLATCSHPPSHPASSG